jgi:hypothetical protein
VQFTGLAALTRRLLPFIVVLVASLVAAPAWADPATESAVKALQKKAIEEDFLNLDYAAAIKKLQTGVSKCGGDKCSSTVKGSVFRDLGAMQILAGNEGDGRASFGQAINFDSSLELDPNYKNPQLEAVWSDVKKKGGGGGGSTAVPTTPPPAGDFAHTAPTEELVRTPLPIYAEYTGGEALTRVIAKYKGAGMSDWKPIELKKTGESGWGAVIPCKDVTQGLMTYYIQGFNAANDPVATSGSRNKPFSVPVKNQIAGDPPALPGQEPPKQCGELAGAECPPDFPGCNTKKASGEDCDKNDNCKSNSCVGGKCAEKKAGGEDCSADDECSSGSCSDSKCAEAKKSEGEDCESGDECESGSCKEGKCSSGGNSKGPKMFVGLAIGLDLYLLPGSQDVCVLNGYGHATPQQGDGTGPLTAGNPYACYTGSGAAFPGTSPGSGSTPSGFALNNAIRLGQSDQVQGGFAHGPMQIMLSFDYALNTNMLLGARAGYELFTVPANAAFPPLHLEARFTYLFGHDALTAKVAPMILVGAGAGEFDAMVPVQVFSKGAQVINANAWLTAGPIFGTAGGGLRFALSKRVFATGAVKLQGAFGGTAGFLFGVVPEAGIQYGF